MTSSQFATTKTNHAMNMVVHRRDPAIYDTPTEACSLRAPLGRMLTPAKTTNRIAVVAAITGLAIGLRPHTVPLVPVVLHERGTGVGAGRSNSRSLRAPGLCEPAGCRLWFTDTAATANRSC